MTIPTVTPDHFKRVLAEHAKISDYTKKLLILTHTEDPVLAQVALFIATRQKETWNDKVRTQDDVYAASLEGTMFVYRLLRVAEIHGNNALKDTLMYDFEVELSGESLQKVN